MTGSRLPDSLPDLGRAIGLDGGLDLRLWDHQRRVLVPLGEHAEHDDATLAELASPDVELVPVEIFGAEAGVLRVPAGRLDPSDAPLLGRVLGAVIASQERIGDLPHRARRVETMSLAAEMQHSLLPPDAFSDGTVSVSAAVEPAYDTGGDIYDYAIDGDRLWATVLDARGHGLRASTVASVATGALRRARRQGRTPTQIADEVAVSLGALGDPDEFVTAVIAVLDLTTWQGRWLSAGHAAPLVIGDDVRALELRPALPLGMTINGEVSQPTVQPFELEPGESLVLYSDGIVENAAHRDGMALGHERFRAALRSNGSELGGGRARRVVEDLLEVTGPVLRDDATLLIVERPR